MYRRQSKLIEAWQAYMEKAAEHEKTAADESWPEKRRSFFLDSAKHELEKADKMEQELSELLRSMEAEGIIPRPLPLALAHLNREETDK